MMNMGFPYRGDSTLASCYQMHVGGGAHGPVSDVWCSGGYLLDTKMGSLMRDAVIELQF